MRKIRVYRLSFVNYVFLMTNEIKSFRDILRAEFQNRLHHNPHYRLLDFAKDLSTPISRMSEIMSGRSGISTQRALHYAETLKLTGEARKAFLQLVSDECSRTKWTRKPIKQTESENSKLKKRLMSTSFHVPAHKKEEFVQFLKLSLDQWSLSNPMESFPEAQIMIEAVEQGFN